MVRGDIPRGIQAANIIHASGESGPARPGTHAVCLVVPDEAALRAVADKLDEHGIKYVTIIESDRPYTDQVMALGCIPGRKEDLRRALSALPLLR